jgi:phosphoribosylformylglycinamidine cyclo-ligase
MTSQPQKTTYRDAGVDVERGDEFVERIKAKVKSTYGARVVSGIGGFAALYDMGDKLLAAGTDGVGTKVKLAQMLGQHDTIGIDLVAMCVNDVMCTGAKPLFFLDYIATGKLDLETAEAIVTGIVEGCKQADMALIGGETAEMPGMYGAGEYDLAGFCIGEVEKNRLIDGSTLTEGDTLIALASSGVHSNGYSLVRKLVQESETDLMRACLTPTRIYWQALRGILPYIHGMAHITGGGFANIPRMNEGFDYIIDTLPGLDIIPPVFQTLAARAGLEKAELYQTFNMGVGMVLATPDPHAVTQMLTAAGEVFWRIGHVTKGTGRVVVTGNDGFTLEND